MDIRKLQRAIVDGLEDVKAANIQVFNTEHLSPLFERVIIASGTSNRQTKALASSVRETVKKRGMSVMSTEGEDNGEWIIVDCGAAVAHIMQPAIRDYYHLEELWGGKAVRMKIDGIAMRNGAGAEPALQSAAMHASAEGTHAAAHRGAGAARASSGGASAHASTKQGARGANTAARKAPLSARGTKTAAATRGATSVRVNGRAGSARRRGG